MDEYEGEFEVESTSDVHAVEKIIERMYDSLREESRTLREGSNDSTEMVKRFEMIRDATQRSTSGKSTVVYESRDEESEG